MKRAISFILQTLLLLAAFFVGSILPVFHVLPLWRISTGPGHWFVLDGLVVLLVLYLLLVFIAFMRGRLRSSGVTSSAALVLALVLGLLSKFPFTSS